ncbi:DNA mismatch repair proteins mutS family domain-containing protein [Plasmodiophora brassicae]|uniref:DNA mismatch repair proteins mutS family domain-containing protein n=1 Tax=Plasmodiophora brassicae TaxID=37360 RepID=A0A0G4IZD2_PLABS|nr:hypothetical protein PBRA_001485 [Plasmodiophora brassicae]SPQ94064.1 unnamed protein product [Plasmodiophora brassicae]
MATSFEMAVADRAAFSRFYRGLTSSDRTTLFVFRQTDDIYTVFGSDADMVAKEFFQNKSFVRTMAVASKGDDMEVDEGERPGEGLNYVNIFPSRLEKLLMFLVNNKRRDVQLYVSSGQEWLPSIKVDAGCIDGINAFLGQDLSSSDPASAIVMSVRVVTKQQQMKVCVATFDCIVQEFGVCEFLDDGHLTLLESLIGEHAPKEVLLETNAAIQPSVEKMLEQRTSSFEVQPKSAFSTATIEQDLRRLLSGPLEHYLAEMDKKDALGAVASLIRHVKLLSNEHVHGRCSLTSLELHQFMKPLDNNAARSLNVFPSVSDSNTLSSLYGILNKCKTHAGSRLLHQWIRQPLLSVPLINERLDLVSMFLGDQSLCASLRDTFLKRTPDLAKLSSKFRQNKAKLEDCVQLYKFVVEVPICLSILEDIKAIPGAAADLLQTKFIRPLDQAKANMAQFESLIEQSIDLDAVERHEFLINAAFTPELTESKQAKDAITKEIDQIAAETDSHLGMKGKIVANFKDGIGFHLRVSRKDEKLLRGKSQYQVVETRKDGVRFVTTRMRALNREYATVSSVYSELQSEIAKKLISVVGSYCPVIDQFNRILSRLDVLSSFATVADLAPIPYCRPELLPLGDRRISLVRSRHPCLEMQPHVESYIPNDVELDGNRRFQIITGPNMGGKSTYLRQIALTVLMAQMGSYVPCDSATIALCDSVLARVGAGDAQHKGISTFYAEMLEASTMIRTATSNSLIIIDELGRGTSTYDGFGLAWAISDYVAKRVECLGLFATHFHELTELANSCPAVVNRHVTAHASTNSITMLYEVKDGPCDRSFGIHVAEIAQFPSSVIEEARLKAEELERFDSEQRSKDDSLTKQFASIPVDELSDEDLLRQCSTLLSA